MRVTCLLTVLILAAVAQGLAVEGAAPVDVSSLTADEHLQQADSAYNRRDYAAAAELYRLFFSNYAQSNEPQIKEIIRRRRYEMAMCQVQLRKFEEATEAVAEALAASPPLDEKSIQELTFWRGVGELESKEYAAARTTFAGFVKLFPPNAYQAPAYVRQFPAASKVPEALLLEGTALLLDEKYADAAAHFSSIKTALPRETRGRATVLEFYSLLEAGKYDEALALVMKESPNLRDMPQIVAFQSLTLQLGGTLIEEGRYRDAIACLQRVWLSERLLKHQNARLLDLESKLAAAEADPNPDPYRTLSLGQQIAKVRREIESFQKIENFDSALRFRLAIAYQAMQRYRESALIMESMLEEMPPDKVVEQASVNLVQSWNAIERWPKVISSSEAFERVFPSSGSLPMVLYLRGIAEQKALDYPAAIATFQRLAKTFPKSEFAPRALFMKGFTSLLADDNPPGITSFEEFIKKHPKHELADAAQYWRAMAFSLDKQFEVARQAMQDYLDERKDGAFRSAAFFRKAYCAQQLEDYQTSINELSEYLRKYPGGEESSEAKVLLGDALMNEGQMEEGIAALESIPSSDTRFYEEGVFKISKALKLMEQYDQMRERMEAFVMGSPKSPRVAEAIFNIGWVYRQNGDPEKAREVYWAAIKEYGGQAEIRSVDDLFPALARLYKGPEEQARYLAKLRDLREEAEAAGQRELVMRALWAQGNALRRAEPEQARGFFVEAAKLAEVESTNPLLLADFAQALQESGDSKGAEAMWRDLMKWNPRAPQKDRALAAMGFFELERGNEKAALGYFDRFERETLGSVIFGKVMLARAALLEERGEFSHAREGLDALLASPSASGSEKAEALYRMGEIHMREGKPQLAVPYFQRIYVMHGKWRDWVARAYFRSGEAFEKLDDKLSARRTYQELGEREELGEFEETDKALKRLQALGGPLPPSENPGPEVPAG